MRERARREETERCTGTERESKGDREEMIEARNLEARLSYFVGTHKMTESRATEKVV